MLAASKTLGIPSKPEQSCRRACSLSCTVRMLLNLILVTALASPTSAFRTSQKLVGRAFGASAG